MNKVKIFVTYHSYDFPVIRSDVFQPIMGGNQGAPLKDGFIGDDTGDNISRLNKNYAELTAHYWILKNYLPTAKEEYIGLCHYRRFLHFGRNEEEVLNLGREYPESPMNLTFYKYFTDYIFDKYNEYNIISVWRL